MQKKDITHNSLRQSGSHCLRTEAICKVTVMFFIFKGFLCFKLKFMLMFISDICLYISNNDVCTLCGRLRMG